MNPIDTIVAATDFGPASAVVIERAAQLARTHGATLVLLHVYDARAWHSLREVFDLPRLLEDPTALLAARARLDETAKSLHERTGVRVQAHACEGSAARAIPEQCVGLRASLLVVGASSDLAEPGLGRTASRLLHAVTCPMLVVRRVDAPYASMLCAVDLLQDTAQAMAPAAFAAALCPQARLQLLYALDPRLNPELWPLAEPSAPQGVWPEGLRAAALRRLRRAAESLTASGSGVEAQVVIDAPARALIQAQADADCIVVGHVPRNALADALLGSVGTLVLHQATRDVLLVP